MKVFAAVLVVFTVQVTMVTSEEEKKKDEVSNIDILSILGKILQRLDVMDKNYKDLKKTVQANRDGTKQVRDEVKGNREVLLRLDLHVRDQQMKLKEVTAITREERRGIAANRRSVNELSQAIDVTLRNISKDVSEVKAVLTEGKNYDIREEVFDQFLQDEISNTEFENDFSTPLHSSLRFSKIFYA